MIMRRFTIEEEQALLFLLAAKGASWRSLPARCGPSAYNRLVALGLAQVLQQGPLRKGKLNATGRYFALLLRAAQHRTSIEITGPGSDIRFQWLNEHAALPVPTKAAPAS